MTATNLDSKDYVWLRANRLQRMADRIGRRAIRIGGHDYDRMIHYVRLWDRVNRAAHTMLRIGIRLSSQA